MAPELQAFFHVDFLLNTWRLLILASLAARNKHFEKNTQTFSQKGSSLPKAVQIKVAARLLEELKAAEPAESGEETLPLDGAEWLGWLRIPSLELELPVQAEWSYPALKTSPCTPEAGLVIAASFEFGGAAAAAGRRGYSGVEL